MKIPDISETLRRTRGLTGLFGLGGGAGNFYAPAPIWAAQRGAAGD